MSKSNILVSIDIKNPIENNVVHGIVKLNCIENIEIDVIEGCILSNINDQRSVWNIFSISFPISENISLSSDTNYEFPFTATIDGSELREYNGKNAYITNELIITIVVNDNYFHKFRPSTFEKIFDTTRRFYHEELFFPPKTCKYSVVEGIKKPQLKINLSLFYVSILITSVILGLIFYLFPIVDKIPMILSIAFLSIINTITLEIMINRLFKPIEFKLSNGEDNFNLKLTIPDSFLLKEMTLNYRTIEEINSRIGKYQYRKKEIIYHSPVSKIEKGKENIITQDFPNQIHLQTIIPNHVEVFWIIEIKGYWLGLPFIFEAPFTVECK